MRHQEAERSLATFILSGGLERFPKLKIVCAENGTDWVPSFVHRLDPAMRRGPSLYPTQLTLKPSEL